VTDLREAKKRERAELRGRLAAASPADVAARSARVVARIEALPEFMAARSVLLFVPMSSRHEVDLRPLIPRILAAGKTAALPRVDWPTRTMTAHAIANLDTDLEPDTQNPAPGLLQPRQDCPAVPANEIDLLLVPGLGFDDAGGRIGHGAGFYDRFLAQPSVRGVVCGVGLEIQVIAAGQRLPCDLHDRPVKMLVTESRVFRYDRFSPAGHAAPG